MGFMKKNYRSIVFLFVTVFLSYAATAQLLPPSCFLQGAYLEIGLCTNSAFGAASPPAGYHPHNSGTWAPSPGAPLAEVYDYGHDGWSFPLSPTPAYMGDYTYPGSPFEGWEVQMNGVRSQQYASPAYAFAPYSYSGAATMTGAGLTTYSNSGSSIRGNWAGDFNGGGATLHIDQETRIDTFASAVVVTTTFHNTSGTPATGVYYWRSCDPDNDETYAFGAVTIPGAGFPTDNVINWQNAVLPNPAHKVEVTGTGQSTLHPPLSLCTKDCRAVAVIYNSWGLTVGQDLGAVWNQTYGGAFYNVGVNHPGDIGIGLVYNIGTIPPGDSSIISYAYVFNGPGGIDDPGALPDPLLYIAGDTIRTFPDTLDGCLYPGIDSLPIDILFASDKDWSWSHWTWSPSTGLASTTGVHNHISLLVLPGDITYTVTGVDSGVYMNDCQYKQFIFTVHTCHDAYSNDPCEGDILQLGERGDSIGATYHWSGPGSFNSTLHNPTRGPVTMADTGRYTVIRTIAGINDTDFTVVIIHPKPVITASNNSPLCQSMVDTLKLFEDPSIPGETFSWTGPGGYTSTQQNPIRAGYVPIDTGATLYCVIARTSYGCKDTACTEATVIGRPAPPVLLGPNRYCQYDAFSTWGVSGLVSGGRILWYANATVPIGDTLPGAPVLDMSTPGVTTVYFSQRSGACESRRDSFKVRIVTTPIAPSATGIGQYCQFIGTVTPFAITPSTADTINWYLVATGGTAVYTEPLPDIHVAGTYNYWVSQTDSGCESQRTPVTITIHPKPHRPVIVPTPICQFRTPVPVQALPDTTGVGATLVAPIPFTWYGPGVTPGTPFAPYPSTTVAPDTEKYWVTETTIYGCVSDSALDVNIVKVKPPVPVTNPSFYCQHASAKLLNTQVDSIGNSHLNWYYNAVSLNPTPRPFTDTVPGTYSWYVSQTVPNDATGCESDSSKVDVTIIYKPVFGIAVSAPYVCQFDSIRLSFCCPSMPLFAASYAWTLPQGAKAVSNTHVFDSSIAVELDTANQNNYVYLRVGNDSGFCYSDDTVRIKVVSQPNMSGFTKGDVCQGDTTLLALSDRSSGAYTFTWWVDKVLLANSPALTIISSNSNSGGPFNVKWIDTGRHVITVSSISQEGCKSYPSFDSVNVHGHPDAGFHVLSADSINKFCLEDSVEFEANTQNYNYGYEWAPAHSFQNINQPVAWGKMEQSESIVTLKVTDPYGCYATTSMTLEPQTCCAVIFPNAFTPNGSTNRLFRPIMSGFHRFHEFKVVNRWGTTVFEGGNTNVSWDGSYNGAPQDMGTYFYYLKYDCGGKTIEAKGDVTLIR